MDSTFRAAVLAATGIDLNCYIRRDPGDISTNDPNWSKVDSWLNQLTLTWDVAENATIKSISGWRRFRFNGQTDGDKTPLRLFRSGDTGPKERGFYQDLQVTGNLFDNRFEYAAGATWYEQESITRNPQR